MGRGRKGGRRGANKRERCKQSYSGKLIRMKLEDKERKIVEEPR